jgi:putative redox protein
MTRAVIVKGGEERYLQNISVGHHLFQADEPVEVGGRDAGPNPYELLLAALGVCTSITVRMYADRKGWPLEDVQVRLAYAAVQAEDCGMSESEAQLVDGIEEELIVAGDLSDAQRRRLAEIAAKCPVLRTLGSSISICTGLATQTSAQLS